jgi:hypothetical protein
MCLVQNYTTAQRSVGQFTVEDTIAKPICLGDAKRGSLDFMTFLDRYMALSNNLFTGSPRDSCRPRLLPTFVSDSNSITTSIHPPHPILGKPAFFAASMHTCSIVKLAEASQSTALTWNAIL